MLTRSVPACRGWSPRSLRGAALEFACWVAQRRQIGVIVASRGPKLEQLPRQGPLRRCLPSRSHLKPPLTKPPPDEDANYHQHGRHHGSDRSRSHSLAPYNSGTPGWDTVALDGPAPARAKPDRRSHPVTQPHLAVNLSSPTAPDVQHDHLIDSTRCGEGSPTAASALRPGGFGTGIDGVLTAGVVTTGSGAGSGRLRRVAMVLGLNAAGTGVASGVDGVQSGGSGAEASACAAPRLLQQQFERQRGRSRSPSVGGTPDSLTPSRRWVPEPRPVGASPPLSGWRLAGCSRRRERLLGRGDRS